MTAPAPVDYAPALHLLAIAALFASVLLGVWWWRQRRAGTATRHVALAALTAFITADLIVFGSFTRLTDSGLGCPDWPGCYGAASPLGAAAPIDQAERALPSGPVTATKAWIEMIHRYLAMAVGALIIVLNAALWRSRGARATVPWWAAAALVWVVVQGLFGRYTVTWKLYPAVVTAHLMGGVVLLALLVAQLQTMRPSAALSAARGAGIVLLLVAVQIALGGWVSSNYAVLACRGFPTCNGQWWPDPDFAQGFQLLRELGRGADGYLSFHALIAIQLAHRLFAAVVTVAVGLLALRLWRSAEGDARRVAGLLVLLLLAQIASGLSNVLLDWPLAAALAHTAGAAGMVALLTSLALRRTAQSSLAAPALGARWRRGRA